MKAARSLPGLLIGLFCLDLLISLPGFEPSSPFVSLLAPSLDLLVIVAFCALISQAAEPSRRGLRIAASLLTIFLAGYEAGSRFGVPAILHLFGDAPASLALAVILVIAALAAAAFACYLLSGLLVNAFLAPVILSSVVLAIAVVGP